MSFVFIICATIGFISLLKKFASKDINKSNKFFKLSSTFLAILFVIWFLLSGGNELGGVYLFNKTVKYPAIYWVKSYLKVVGITITLALHTFTLVSSIFSFPIIDKLKQKVIPVLGIIAFVTAPLTIRSYAQTDEITFKAIAICLLMSIEYGIIFGKIVFDYLKISKLSKTEKDVIDSQVKLREVIIATIIIILFATPDYIYKVIMPEISSKGGLTLDFGVYHRIYLYICFAYLIGMTIMLRNRKGEFSRMVLDYIAIATLITYSSGYSFKTFISPWNWPLHICNTAMFILAYTLTWKNNKVFYFTFFVNILGALLAALAPNTNALGAANSVRNVGFWSNHMCAFTMPLICVFLGVYERPKFKQFCYSLVSFSVYYVFVLILNPLLTNHNPADPVDFFYINSDFIASKLGDWALALRDLTIDFDIGSLHFTYYPIYQSLYFIVFIAISVGMWFVYTWLFRLQDHYIAIGERYKVVKMDELALLSKYNEKEVSKCMNKDSVNKLVVKGFGKRYGSNKDFAVRDINFEVKGGEILGFLGPNGAGKSTTIKSVVGIQLPTEGSIEINGYDIVKQPVEAKLQLGFVPDHYALYENLTGREYLNYIADLYNVSLKDRNEFLNEYLKTLEMDKAIDSKMQTYSHGMKQKMALMASIIHNPKLWILDEPLTGLDPASIYQVKECLKAHAKKGNIVFFSSHLIDIVEKLCDRIIIISNHKVAVEADVKELLKKGVNLEEFYMQYSGQQIPGK